MPAQTFFRGRFSVLEHMVAGVAATNGIIRSRQFLGLSRAVNQSVDPATLEFDRQGTPVSSIYGDVYHSASGAPAQARHVFLAGNGLPTGWQGRARFTILETGFGLGINFMATWQAWRADSSRCSMLHFVSLEKHPFSAQDLAAAHRAWPEFTELSQALCTAWPALTAGTHRLSLAGGQVTLTLVFGDALVSLPELDCLADALYLDGFSPAKNPELWSSALVALLVRHAHAETTLATWSVAGGVRRALTDAGFSVSRVAGFGSKRQMLVGRFLGGPEALREATREG